MPRLNSPDNRKYQELVREIYTLGSVHDFPARMARLLPRLIAADAQGSADMNYGTQCFTAVREPALDEQDQARLNAAFVTHIGPHPLATMPGEVVNGTSLILSQTVGRRDLEKSDLYHHFYREVSSRDELAMSIPLEPGRALCFFLWRASRCFSPNDLEQIELLRPHVEHAYRNARCFTEASGGSLLADVSEALARGLVLLDADGSVREWSERARRLSHRYFPDWPLGARHLPEALRRWVRGLMAQRADCEKSACARPAFQVEGAEGRLTVRLAHRQCPGEFLIVFEEQLSAPSPRVLEAIGLTPRESVIASWVAQGKTNPEIATILDANTRTIKVHLTHIFAKLGVETRTAAALRITECWREAE